MRNLLLVIVLFLFSLSPLFAQTTGQAVVANELQVALTMLLLLAPFFLLVLLIINIKTRRLKKAALEAEKAKRLEELRKLTEEEFQKMKEIREGYKVGVLELHSEDEDKAKFLTYACVDVEKSSKK